MSSLEFPSSRPECQLAQTNLLYQHHGCGVKTSQAQTMDKLGLVSPAYTSGRSGSKGIIGGVGYLSPTYTTLLPATGSRNHDSVAAHTHARSTSVGGPMRSTGNRGGSSSSTSRKGGITHEDLEYLKENEKRNQEAWEAWSRARDSDNRQQKNAALRKQKADMQRFFRREAEIQQEIELKVHEWEIRKGLQEEMQIMKQIQSLQKRTTLAAQSRIKSAISRTVNAEREGGFDVRTSPMCLPTKHGFDATLPPMRTIKAKT